MIPTFDSTFLVEDIHDPALKLWSKSDCKIKEEETSSEGSSKSRIETEIAGMNQNSNWFGSKNGVPSSQWNHQKYDDDDNFSDEDSVKASQGYVSSLFSWTSDLRSLAVCVKQTAGDVAQFVHHAAMNVANEIALMDEFEQREEEEKRRKLEMEDQNKDRQHLVDSYPGKTNHDYDMFCRNHLLPWHISKKDESDSNMVEFNSYELRYDEDMELKSKILEICRSSFYEDILQLQKLSHDDGDDDFVLDDKWVHLILRLIKIDNNLFLRIQEFIKNVKNNQQITAKQYDEDSCFCRESSASKEKNDFRSHHVFVSEITKPFWNFYFRQVAEIRKDHLSSLDCTDKHDKSVDYSTSTEKFIKSKECITNTLRFENSTDTFNQDIGSSVINNGTCSLEIGPNRSNIYGKAEDEECGSENSLVVTDDDVEESEEEDIAVAMKNNVMIESLIVPNTIGKHVVESATPTGTNPNFPSSFEQGQQGDMFPEDIDDDIDESSYVFCIHKEIGDMALNRCSSKLVIASAPASANSISSLVIVDAATLH